MKAKKKLQVTTEESGIWDEEFGYFCVFVDDSINNHWALTGRICKRRRDARRSFINLCNKLGIPRKNYEFVD